MKNIIPIVLVYLFSFSVFAQENPKWDDVKSKNWPTDYKIVSIKSSIDGKAQAAYFYKSKSKEPRPLIVSLHTWSGGYDQKDTLSWSCIEKDYNYIHPDFRGPNWTFEACGSHLAINDIEDAITYAIENSKVDKNNIHVIGVSGGGYSTLLTYMNTKHKIASYSAWVPISNIVEWYYESEGRSNKYSKEIAQSTTGKEFKNEPYYFDKEEAVKRSPIFMDTPVKERMDCKLYIYAGVHDGYTGSVPITHSINFYNKLVKDFNVNEKEALIPTEDIIDLVTFRGFVTNNKGTIGDREIHYMKKYEDLIQIIIFEGGHESLSDVALDHIEKQK